MLGPQNGLVGTLPAGTAKRVVLARELLLLDEPAAGLDPEVAAELSC
jgi:ABC-type transporter Mla maintaining outer membrane lipid asymmetry ATPase subunit MlaF